MKTWGILLGILNMGLVVLCVVLLGGKDRNVPKVWLTQTEAVYRKGMEEEELLSWVEAYDEEDGELTKSVVIEKIATDGKNHTASITYGVADRAGNVGKVTCRVTMEVEEQEGKATPADTDPVEESGGREEEPDTGEPAEEETTDLPGEETREEPEEESGEEGTDTAQALPTAGEAENMVQTVSSRQDEGRPSMVFKSREVKVQAGTMPAWVEVLEGLHDDKDDYATLLQSLTLHGEYDISRAGTYSVSVTVTDSDGKESNAYPITLIVEE